MNNTCFEADAQLYSAKLSLFDSYINRAWQRFNWILTLEFAWMSIFLTHNNDIKKFSSYLILWAFAGFVLSVIWAIIGYEDDRSIQRYSKQIKHFESLLLSKLDTNYSYSDENKSTLKIRQTGWLFWIPIFFVSSWLTIICFLSCFK